MTNNQEPGNKPVLHKRLKRECKTIEKMIGLYCCKKHKTSAGQLCDDCFELARYAAQRTENCPFGPAKPTCAKCPIHCYKPIMRHRIRQVMRYAGPRMLIRYPHLAILHLLDGFRHSPKPKT
jgi:hypothetical protein